MDKKTLTIILIAAAVLLVMYYLYSKKNQNSSSETSKGGSTTGNADGNSGGNDSSGSNTGGTGTDNSSVLGTAYCQSLTEEERAYLKNNRKMVGNVLNRTVDYYTDSNRDAYGNLQASYERALCNYWDDMAADQQEWMQSHCPNVNPVVEFVRRNWSEMKGNYEADTKSKLNLGNNN